MCLSRWGSTASRHNSLVLARSPSLSGTTIDCGTRRAIENVQHRVAKRCLYPSEKPSFRGTLTTPATCELNVALGDAMGGEMGLKHEDDRQHTFTGGLDRVHKTVNYVVNDWREDIHDRRRRFFRAPRFGGRFATFGYTARRLGGTPVRNAGRGHAGFSSRSWVAGGVHPLGFSLMTQVRLRPLAVKILMDVFTNGSRKPRRSGQVNHGADMRHVAQLEHFRHISASFGPWGRTSFCRCTP